MAPENGKSAPRKLISPRKKTIFRPKTGKNIARPKVARKYFPGRAQKVTNFQWRKRLERQSRAEAVSGISKKDPRSEKAWKNAPGPENPKNWAEKTAARKYNYPSRDGFCTKSDILPQKRVAFLGLNCLFREEKGAFNKKRKKDPRHDGSGVSGTHFGK